MILQISLAEEGVVEERRVAEISRNVERDVMIMLAMMTIVFTKGRLDQTAASSKALGGVAEKGPKTGVA